MSLRTSFAAAGGSVIGRDHAALGRNNQDAFALLAREDLAIAVVADGCSSGGSSEVGAKLGARWIARALSCSAPVMETPESLACGLGSALAVWLDTQLQGLAGPARAAEIADLWLFTFLAAVVTPRHAVVLGIGDGLFAADAQVRALDAGPDNAPPYAAYALLERRLPPEVQLHLACAPEDIDALVVATDGLLPCPEALPRLAADPALLKNPFVAQRRLSVLSRERRLGDDCSVGVLRRVEG